jgi:AcrR family transcriptional regulator
MTNRRDDARLNVARHAARLFVEHGVAATSGAQIAAAAGLSERTVWRYFPSKESCVEPLFMSTAMRFHTKLQKWPRTLSIEAHLQECCKLDGMSPQEVTDGVLVVQLLARMTLEPALRAVWLLSCHDVEQHMIALIADRLDRSNKDFDIRLCAATVSAAMRMIDETISIAAIEHGQEFTTEQVVHELAQAIRKASTLPICDPVTPNIFGASHAAALRQSSLEDKA